VTAMSERMCALAAETKVETPEGAMAIRTVAGKAIAVFTRENGRVRFRMMFNVRKVAEAQPVLRVTLDSGDGFRVGPEQIVYKKGMTECRADALRVGDYLEPMFHYPEQYEFVDNHDGSRKPSPAALRIVHIETGGTADLYALGVNRTGCFFLSAGALCKAEASLAPMAGAGEAPAA
jgi:hypothetical protein